MTLFETNLAELRRRAGYTQESLAEALGVSRQAVGKWESGQGLPEAATLLALADLLGCSLDQLMRQPLDREVLEKEDPAESWAILSQHIDRFSVTIALGVVLVLVGVALTVAAAGVLGESPVVALPVLLCVAGAVFLFVFGGIDHGNYQRAYPVQPVCPDPDLEAEFDARFRVGLAAAVAGILVCVALEVASGALFEGNETLLCFATAGFLLLLGLCVGATVYLGIQREKFQPAPEEPEGPNLSGAIMLTATAVFLLLGFFGRLWHPGWVAFPIGGILCAILDNLKRK